MSVDIFSNLWTEDDHLRYMYLHVMRRTTTTTTTTKTVAMIAMVVALEAVGTPRMGAI